MYFNYYILGIILLPGILLAIYAQATVSLNFEKYSKIASQQGLTASEVARLFLDNAGLSDVQIVRSNGHLTDYYSHRNKVIALSNEVYDSNSISAIGIACHEVGHALQYHTNYFPIKLRNMVIPICNVGNNMLWFLILIGGVFYYSNLGLAFLYMGVIIYTFSVILNLITLPVEYNASKRATEMLNVSTILTEEEVKGAKKVLNAAALTYIAGLIISVLNLLRFIFAILLSNRRD